MVSYAQMGRALVTGIQEVGGHRWSGAKKKKERGGSLRKQSDKLNLGRKMDRWMRGWLKDEVGAYQESSKGP